MRIISGLAKGVRLATPPVRQQKDGEIRPTSDLGREALFSILSSRLRGASVLDLYAGTGALGLEALSRGAKLAIFVDNSPLSLEIIQKNILACFARFSETVIVRTLSIDLPVTPLPYHQLPEIVQEGFDLIFADPPYGTGLSEKSIKNIAKQKLLKQDGLLIVEERRNVALDDKIANFTLSERRIYGEVSFHFYREAHNDTR